ncbi:hypothetical protein M409DRAFT_66756 [Zasmidium cellare ATCC 36951]|uniref:DUF4419 domain-containing protein n=1 Tax=Zasmidium cellare ATCC 36951 TaxID=1080233 RepID=A0A6A6CGE1_ZASCE|nr:uncharacterized protein M409DRAFT_66756 [Zasmidium cellare ATCC 36951]KAF2166254.1 hypothetical protein M409DRAFT_66756 [Zasmidium cellare ATCC 36951]
MPITAQIARHAANPLRMTKERSDTDLFSGSCEQESENCKEIIQSSFTKSVLRKHHVVSSANGFVNAALTAYSSHHHLILRPDDIWFAILSQLSLFINAHAEDVRHLFVSHEGQKELVVVDRGSIDFADFGKVAVRMTDEIQANVLDPALKTWAMPDFSTTTESDRVVAAVLMMGSLQKYFQYRFQFVCGIPSVTLLGEREDWAKLVGKIGKLASLGDECAKFAELLEPVLVHFVETFDHPSSETVVDFWQRIAFKVGGGSGARFLSGWITAFCFWNEDGGCMYDRPMSEYNLRRVEGTRHGCELGGVRYHRVDTADIPPGWASVPVELDDHGEITHTRMVAGSVAIEGGTSSGANLDDADDGPKETLTLDSVQPMAGWWVYEVKSEEKSDDCNEAKK